MVLGLVVGIVFVALWFVVLFDCWWLDLIVVYFGVSSLCCFRLFCWLDRHGC